jgi:hypothetical protein
MGASVPSTPLNAPAAPAAVRAATSSSPVADFINALSANKPAVGAAAAPRAATPVVTTGIPASALTGAANGGAIASGLAAIPAGLVPTPTNGQLTLNDPVFKQLNAVASKSAISTGVFNALKKNNVPINVIPARIFNRQNPGAGAFYDPKSGAITMPDSALKGDLGDLALILTHEGTHFLDHIYSSPGGSAGASAAEQGASVLNSADYVGNMQEGGHPYALATETHAYSVEAQAAKQLGVDDWGLGTDQRTGRILTAQQVLQSVATNPLYANET